MTDLVAAIGLALMIEGLLYAAFPVQMKQMLASLLAAPVSVLRTGALFCAGLGLVLLWLARG